MSTSSPATRRWLSLLAVWFVLVALIPSAAQAQDPPPQPQSTAEPVDPSRLDAQVIDLDAVAAAEAAQPAGPEPASAEEDSSGAEISLDAVGTAGVQGDVRLDVATPADIRAGDFITYTYAYTNTNNTAVSGVTIQAIWNDFSTSVNGSNQFCAAAPDTPANCDVLSVAGPTVTKASCVSNGCTYNIGTINPNGTGNFSVRLRTKRTLYPQTNKSLTYLAGSANLRKSGSNQPVSQDTASSLVAGPVLVLTKAPLTPGDKIYTGQNAVFELTLGNATGTNDRPNGIVRADARTARNIVVVDSIPPGSSFVSADPAPASVTGTEVRWTIAGPLLPGSTAPKLRVTFKKETGNPGECYRVNNSALKTWSDEYPFEGTNRYTVPGVGASIPVVVPVVIKSIGATPKSVVYGAQGTISIVVQSFWSEPVNNIELTYDMQSNATYAGGANPAPSSATSTQVKWVFNMPAANKNTPQERTFSLQALAGYTNSATGGQARLTVPSNVPSDCASKDGRMGVSERLQFRKYTDTDPETKIGSNYIVDNGQEFEYILELVNLGTAPATNIDIVDAFPTAPGANFTYIGGSANIAPTPITVGNGNGLRWDNLSAGAGETLEIRYRLRVEGQDYVVYCNNATATKDDTNESIRKNGTSVCVKINPQIEVTKTADKTTVEPAANEEIRFTLTLTNRDKRPYTVGLYDDLKDFTFVRQESGYDTPILDPTKNDLKWPLRTLQVGQTISAVIVARAPTACVTKDYENEALFHNDQGNVIQPVPAVKVKVRVNCGTLEYTSAADRGTISLRDRINYEVRVKNADSKDASNVVIENLLPPGFTFVSMDGQSNVTNLPSQTISDTQTLLTWTVPSIKANTEIKVKFRANSGDVIGQYKNMARVQNGGKCVGRTGCESASNGQVYAVHTVKVDPLITLEPKIIESGCAQPGSTRTYKVSVVNRNDHEYKTTAITVTLPVGLEYVRPLSDTLAPALVVDGSSQQQLIWRNLTIPAKSGIAFQKDFVVELRVGNVIGYLSAIVQASSQDGSIPRKEGVVDPTVLVCLNDPAVSKTANRLAVQPNSEVIYQITLANPKTTAYTVSIEDRLPNGMTFIEYMGGTNGQAPVVSGNTLRWENMSLPAASANTLGIIVLKFKVQVPNAAVGTAYKNTATVQSTLPNLDKSRDSVTVTIARNTYLPVVGSR